MGINYILSECSNAFGGIHKGFSPPGTPNISNTSFQARPEKSISYELGYRYFKNGINLQVVGFLNDYLNILGSDFVCRHKNKFILSNVSFINVSAIFAHHLKRQHAFSVNRRTFNDPKSCTGFCSERMFARCD